MGVRNYSFSGLNYRALGNVFFKYITSTHIDDTGNNCRAAFLYFIAKLCFSKNGDFYYVYDARGVLHALRATYNLFFYAGMYGVDVSIYAPTKFKHM